MNRADTISSEDAAGRRNDEARNDAAGQVINAATDAATVALAGRVLKMLRSVADTELSMGEIAKGAGASLTQARAAVALLVKAGDVVMCIGGYYSAVVAS